MIMIGNSCLRGYSYDKQPYYYIRMSKKCKICNSEFTFMFRKHMCRLCRADICDSCSVFKGKHEIESETYNWCRDWISDRMPNMMTFITREDNIRFCRHCGNWNMRELQMWYIFIMSKSLSLEECIKMGRTNSQIYFLTNMISQRCKRIQKQALRYHENISNEYRGMQLMIHKNRPIIQHRWNCIQKNEPILQAVRQTFNIVDVLELLWQIKSVANIDQIKRRTIWGMLWNHMEHHLLVYELTKGMGLQGWIPQNIENKYGVSEQSIIEWSNWLNAKEVDIDMLPMSKNPIWNNIDFHSIKHKLLIVDVPSATKPKLLLCPDGKGILWKRETGSVDAMIEYSTAVCFNGLKQAGLLKYDQIYYRVVNLKKDIVAIQIVPNSISLSKLVQQKKSILQYVCDKNDSVPVQKLRQRIMESVAFMSAISWFFGFGDRHLDNIMIHKSGTIFHIDFGYCFGREPKIGVPRIRITQDMISSMGDEYWKQCLVLGQKCMDWLRENIDTLRILSDSLSGDSKGHIDSHWKKIMADDQVTFKELAEESVSSWTTSIHDFFHSNAQSFRSWGSLW